MTAKDDLPDTDTVLKAKAELLADAYATGERPTVIALARQLGVTNATFWRHFPDIAREVAAAGRNEQRDDHADRDPSPLRELERQNAQLRRTNHDLRLDIKLAEASIQRLAIVNHQLRRELEAATGVTRIDDKWPKAPSKHL
jgi:transposase-like protein